MLSEAMNRGTAQAIRVLLWAAIASTPAAAQAAEPVQAEAIEKGRLAYELGLKLSDEARWAEALQQFRIAAKVQDVAKIEYNIALCQLALGDYVTAWEALVKVLRAPTGLPEEKLERARVYLAEIEHIIVHLDFSMEPESATIAINGRGLIPSSAEQGTFVLGAPNESELRGPKRHLKIVLNPGVQIFRATRPGHEDAVKIESYQNGAHPGLSLVLHRLPGRISLQSEPVSGVVRVDTQEVGVAPLQFERPAGVYRVEVFHKGYDTYSTRVALAPGQQMDLTAPLRPTAPPITTKWWFWAGGTALLSGVGVVTYLIVNAMQPGKGPPPYETGNTNWLIEPQGVKF